MAMVLGFDFGLRRIGVAVGQPLTATASPLAPLAAKEGIPDWSQIAAVLDEWQPGLVVVGEPINMDGSDSELAQRARKFARRLHGRFGLKVEMADERLTSYSVKEEVKAQRGPQDFGKYSVDSEAAVLILEQWLRAERDN